MYIVITGDVVNSRKVDSNIWLPQLKEVLNLFGSEVKDWDIYRGDSFQIILKPERALVCILTAKSKLKQLGPLDIRFALGMGDVSYLSSRVLESNGKAFIYSGECYENLKKSTLKIKSDFNNLDHTLNLMFSLLSLVIDQWKPVTANVIHHKILNLDLTQTELAIKLGKKSQASVSEALKRGGFEEIERLLMYFEEEIRKVC